MKYIALIVGILSLIASLDPKIGFFVGYLAFFLGYVVLRKDRDSKLAKASMILGGIGFGLSLVHFFVTVFWLNA